MLSICCEHSKSSLTGSSSSGILSELLVLPKPENKSNRKRKPALTVWLTDNKALEELKTKEKEKNSCRRNQKGQAVMCFTATVRPDGHKADYVCLTLKMRRITPYAQSLAWCAKMTQIGFRVCCDACNL